MQRQLRSLTLRPVQAAYFTMCLRPPRQRRLRRQLFYPLGQWGAQLPRPWAQLALTVPILATVVPPRAVGRGASRVTRRCLRCACACRRYVIGIQLGSLFLRDTGVDLSTYTICIFSSAVRLLLLIIGDAFSRTIFSRTTLYGTLDNTLEQILPSCDTVLLAMSNSMRQPRDLQSSGDNGLLQFSE